MKNKYKWFCQNCNKDVEIDYLQYNGVPHCNWCGSSIDHKDGYKLIKKI